MHGNMSMYMDTVIIQGKRDTELKGNRDKEIQRHRDTSRQE